MSPKRQLKSSMAYPYSLMECNKITSDTCRCSNISMVDKIGPILRPGNDDFIFTCEPYTELLKGEVTSSCRSPSHSTFLLTGLKSLRQASRSKCDSPSIPQSVTAASAVSLCNASDFRPRTRRPYPHPTAQPPIRRPGGRLGPLPPPPPRYMRRQRTLHNALLGSAACARQLLVLVSPLLPPVSGEFAISGRVWCCDVGSRLDLLDSDGLPVDALCLPL
jgi:hypothetical protein